MKYIVYILTFFISMISVAQNDLSFEQGNTLYNNGKYAEAIAKYETILNTGEHSATLYYNLGNSHYKLNHIAPSIYYFEKALQLSPNDKDIQNNITFSRNMTIDAVDVIPEVGFSKVLKEFTNRYSFNVWAYVSVITVFLFVLLYIVYYFSFSTTKKRLAFIGSSFSLILACVALFFAFNKFSLDKNNKPAIVFAQESQVKVEPNSRSEEAFRLHEGTKVQILDTVNNWKKIKLTDGKTGWIENSDIKAL